MSKPTPVTQPHNCSPMWFLMIVSTAINVVALVVGRAFLIPLAIAGLIFVFSLVLDDTCRRIRIGNWTPNKWISRLMTICVVLASLGGIIMLWYASFGELARIGPEYAARLEAKLDQMSQWIPSFIIDSILNEVTSIDVQPWVTALVGQVTGTFAVVSLVGFYVVFLFFERDAWEQKLPKIAKTSEDVARAKMMIAEISKSVKKYVWINTVTSALSALIAYAIFWLVGLDFAILLALVVFVAGYIPTIGSLIGIALPAMVAFLQFDSFGPFIVVLFGFGLADQLVANLPQPALQGKSLNISTFVVVAALAFWGVIWGGIGMFLAIPLTVMIMIVCAQFPATRWFAILLSKDGQIGAEEDPDAGV
ncbi:AI-2E family transporter [Litoreibacter albidus]|uniref:AI-2E family transporter n=1 Tax=Litoreibacter albidus TaxID=670155 RepID=UPI0037353F2A